MMQISLGILFKSSCEGATIHEAEYTDRLSLVTIDHIATLRTCMGFVTSIQIFFIIHLQHVIYMYDWIEMPATSSADH